ncbi:MAG: RNA polymerase sigma factor [bacterium]|nr:RNA polymerase sigma factor [bacterium]
MTAQLSERTPATKTAETGGAGALVRRIRAGDRRAEEELVARYSMGVEVVLAQLTRNPSLAEDIRQETLALVLTKIRDGELRQPEALPGFLRSVARNLLIAECRKEARYSSLDQEPTATDLTPGPARPPAEAPQLRQLLADEEAKRVRQLLGELRFQRDREILVRYYLTGDSKDEICCRLDVDPDLFNRVLYRARQRLRELWERSEKRLRLGESRT